MEAWKHTTYNKYTRENKTVWTILMNDTTPEWNVGPFPTNVEAINSTEKNNDTFADAYLPGTIFIETSKGTIGDRDVEKVIFGLTSAIVILGMAVWTWLHWGQHFAPKRESSRLPERARSPTGSGGSVTVADNGEFGSSAAEGGFLTDQAFRHLLATKFYHEITSHVEVPEKNPLVDDIDGEDIEVATDLLRKMYGYDLDVWSWSHAQNKTDADKRAMVEKSEAILAEVRRLIGEWEPQSLQGWRKNNSQEELQQYQKIVSIMSRVPMERYKNQEETAEVEEEEEEHWH